MVYIQKFINEIEEAKNKANLEIFHSGQNPYQSKKELMMKGFFEGLVFCENLAKSFLNEETAKDASEAKPIEGSA